MTLFIRYLTILALMVALSPIAQAQEGDWYVTGSAVYNDDDPDRKLDDGVSGIKLGGGWNFNHWLTLEGALTYSNIDGFYREPPGPYFYADEDQLDLEASFLAYYDRDAVFAPYALLGFGYQNADLNLGDKENNPTASFGAGFKWRMGDSPFAVRAEVRSRTTFDGGDRDFTDFIATLGVQYSFGSTRQKITAPSDKPADTVGDGVLDMWDACPDTPAGVDVTARGCEIKNIDNDSDNDRVPDSRDECPNTPAGAPVGPTGCSLDADMDGVQTGQDRCPGTRPGAKVDVYGCELKDDDNDGVPNNADRCPNPRTGVDVDTFGCEIREVISLPGVNFQSGSDLLVAGAENLVKQAANTLIENPRWDIEVAGHTDSVGDEIDNQGLSDRRAKTVYDFLVKYGVSEDRLSFRGYGESQPIASNDTSGGRAINRRVELRVAKR